MREQSGDLTCNCSEEIKNVCAHQKSWQPSKWSLENNIW